MKNLFIENIPYRELMITGYGLVYSRGRNDSDWKKKITRENFLNSQNFALSKFFLLFFCSWSSLTDSAYEESWGSIYRRGFGLEILLNLQSWKSLKSITCRDSWVLKSAEGEFIFFVKDLLLSHPPRWLQSSRK